MAGRNADSQGPSWPSESESAFEQVSQGVPSAAMARTLVCPLIFFSGHAVSIWSQQKGLPEHWYPYSSSMHTQLCLTLCDPFNYSLPGSSVHGILQARILEWVAISSSRGSSRPRDRPASPAVAGGFFTTELALKLP